MNILHPCARFTPAGRALLVRRFNQLNWTGAEAAQAADEKGATAAAFLRRAAAWLKAQGVIIERVMTDNGSGYVSKDFAAAIAEIRARHLRTRPYTPRTNGKAKPFIQTMLREEPTAGPSPPRTAAGLPCQPGCGATY